MVEFYIPSIKDTNIQRYCFNKYQKWFLERIPCMVPQCSMCEIKGSETKMPTINTLAYCKALCLKTSWCTGIDYSISDECYLNAEDVKVVGTKFDPFYKAFRKDTCLGDTLPIIHLRFHLQIAVFTLPKRPYY